MVRRTSEIEQWIKFFLTGVIDTAKNGKETLKSIVGLCKQYEDKIVSLGRKMPIAKKLLSSLFSFLNA